MKKIGFTGTREGMKARQLAEFSETLHKLANKGDEFHHGDCLGADEDASLIAEQFGLIIHVHPPISDSKRAFTNGHVFYEPRPYLVRNFEIVETCDLLIATPKTNKEVLRSGTWATIRYARKRHKQVVIVN